MKIYQQIINDYRSKIQLGQLKKGEKLPSVRQISQSYTCSKDTVQKALLELKYQHYIYARDKSGHYVLGNPLDKSKDLEASLTEELPEAAADSFEDFKICLNQSFDDEATLFNFSKNQQGLMQLVVSLQRLLASYDVYVSQQNIAVTSGIQQALYILTQMTFPNQKARILLEQPTYHRMNNLIKALKLPCEMIERNWEGLNLKQLENIFAQGQIKFFYTIPRLHNPLGTRLPLEQQKAIIELAETYDVYIIEDDYMGDFDLKHAPAMHYHDPYHRIIYLKSFNTSIFPALRLGAVALPTQLIQPFLQYKQLMDYDTQLLMQKALALYLDNGMFDSHQQVLRSLHAQKVTLLKNTLSKHKLDYPDDLTDCKLALPVNHLSKTQVRYLFTPDQVRLNHQLTTLSNNYIHLNLNPIPLNEVPIYLEETLGKI